MTPLGKSNDPLGAAYDQKTQIYIYITIHSSSRIAIMKQQQKPFFGWGGSPQHGKLY